MIRIATRSSALAKAQAGQVAGMLGGAELVECSSDGEAGDKARFVRGVERALLAGEAEIGVHSAKDLPAKMPEGLAIAAVPAREDASDVWIGAPSSGISRQTRPGGVGALEGVPEGARVGSASLRRRAQLLAARPDLRVEELHGNVDTRLRRLAEGELDAIVLAAAGLRRLGRESEASFAIPSETMTPAAGQGALVLQMRAAGDAEAGGGGRGQGNGGQGREDEAAGAAEAAARIGDETALRELTAERAVVALLDASCATPIGVHARVGPNASGSERGKGSGAGSPPGPERETGREGKGGGPGPRSDSEPETGREPRLRREPLVVEAFVGLPDGREWIRDRVEGEADDPAAAGALLAERLLGAGAREILDRAEAAEASR
jgi:hydroxymethylbilane synthase